MMCVFGNVASALHFLKNIINVVRPERVFMNLN